VSAGAAVGAEAVARHVISALVVDRPGTLNRVAGLFRARTFNIESLTVGSTHQEGLSRMTVVLRGDEPHLHQVLAQLERLIEVIEVSDLTHGPGLELELALVEIEAPVDDAAKRAIENVMAGAGGALVSVEDGAWRLRLTAPPAVVEDALAALRVHGLRNLVRAGSVAMATGPQASAPAASPGPTSTRRASTRRASTRRAGARSTSPRSTSPSTVSTPSLGVTTP
jgi:acetolactate synthase-1/3 small subunit